VLCAEQIAAATSFAQLLSILDEAKPRGVGELTIYDTAVRIGYGQNLKPEVVYLHAGTRKGARRLQLDVRRPFIPHTEIPKELDGLSPAEIEDVLCTYARFLGTGAEKFPTLACDGQRLDGCVVGAASDSNCS
jgi:hypothetical protein